jgi:translation elongation factor P/translation initiation factor 5A
MSNVVNSANKLGEQQLLNRRALFTYEGGRIYIFMHNEWWNPYSIYVKENANELSFFLFPDTPKWLDSCNVISGNRPLIFLECVQV